MPLEQDIMTLMKDAMKAKDEAGLRGLRAIKAAIIIAKTAEGANGELKAEDELFLLPDWVGAEVTGEARYYNSSLIRQPFTQWTDGA